MRRALILVLLVAGALAPATARTAESDSVAIRLVEGPSDRADDPRARQYIVDHVNPGDRLTRRFAVDNRTAGRVDVQLYDAAAAVTADGFQFGEGRAENDLTAWTSVSPGQVSIAPGATAEATVTIAVPEGASGGERYAVIWAELPPAESGGVAVVNRVGIRIYLSVGGDEEPPTDFRLKTFTPVRDDAGNPGVDIRACNEGGRAVDLEGELELSEGPGGTSAGPFPSAGARTLPPGACGDLAIRVPNDIPAGPWRARATLKSGRVTETAEATISFPSERATVSGPVDAERVTDSPGGRLAILLAILLLLLLLLGLLLFLLSKRRRKSEEPTG